MKLFCFVDKEEQHGGNIGQTYKEVESHHGVEGSVFPHFNEA